LRALLDRWAERQKREDLRFGVLASIFANAFRKSDAEPFVPGHFFSSLREEAREPTPEESDELLKKILGGGEER
jgi:hypothetical protein